MRSRGIVLNSVRYNDSHIIVSIFTEEAGLVSFFVTAARERRNGIKASAWQPLAFVEVMWEPRLNTYLQKPRELVLWRSWRSLAREPRKTAMCLFLSEFLHYALRGEQENKPMFAFIVDALLWFDENNGHFENFHIVFLLRLTRFLGFMPNANDWCDGYFFDLQTASFTRVRPYHNNILMPEEAAWVPKFMRMGLRSLRVVGLNRELRRRVLEIVTEFYRLHIPEFPETKSLDVLREVFD